VAALIDLGLQAPRPRALERLFPAGGFLRTFRFLEISAGCGHFRTCSKDKDGVDDGDLEDVRSLHCALEVSEGTEVRLTEVLESSSISLSSTLESVPFFSLSKLSELALKAVESVDSLGPSRELEAISVDRSNY